MNLSDGDLADMKEVAQQSQVEGKACLVSPAVLLALVEEVERARGQVPHPPIELRGSSGVIDTYYWNGAGYMRKNSVDT